MHKNDFYSDLSVLDHSSMAFGQSPDNRVLQGLVYRWRCRSIKSVLHRPSGRSATETKDKSISLTGSL